MNNLVMRWSRGQTSRTKALALFAALGLVAVGVVLRFDSTRVQAAAVRPAVERLGRAHIATRPNCLSAARGYARCQSLALVDLKGQFLTKSDLLGYNLSPYGPAELQSAYNLPSNTAGKGQTIGIVDAFDAPKAEADLAVYRSAYGLPPCTGANGCFSKVDQRGGRTYPVPDVGWAAEASLDIDMASAICPNCHVLLVEADDNQSANLAVAVDEAVKLGANVVSNSYGAFEQDGENDLARHYNHPGVAIIASSGDFGYVVAFPAAYSSVVAVGGTTLFHYTNDPSWHESAWIGAGSGCSAYVSKPSFQQDKLCHMRTVSDVSAVADPETPVAVYDSYGLPGWVAFGGTSVSSPIIAGVYALAGNTASIQPLPYLYSHTQYLFDVTTGSSFGFCAGDYLCTAGPGYDGPTGNGTPNGIGAF